MQVAILDNKTVYADEALYEYGRNRSYICPCCGEKVILKAGDIKIPYFSHLVNSDCIDDYDNEMSEWHRYCQSLFPKEYREVIITKTYAELYPDDPDYIGDMTTETHIADICYKNYVIEFQHSPMDPDEFDTRTDFYTRAGYKLIWIFDWNNKDLEVLDVKENKYGVSYKWKVKNAPHTCKYFVPQDNKDTVALFFSIDNPECDDVYADCDGITLHRITWAIPKDYYKDNCDADYKCIFTQVYLGQTIEELAETICKKCGNK